MIKKIQAMTAKEIIMAMVEGLENPTTVIDMGTFKTVSDGVCFGCAATNTICNIFDFKTHDLVHSEIGSMMVMSGKNDERDFLYLFENAIDFLRMNHLRIYNEKALEGIFSTITNSLKLELPELTNDYTQEQLNVYRELANSQ